jgi:hypothetical protein
VDESTGIVGCSGHRAVCVPFEYLGADDRVGPSSTGQPSVGSFYRSSRT